MAAGGVLGAIAGFMAVTRLGENKLPAVVMFVSIFVPYIFGIIIHEGGHLVMGLLTGYKFVSFRVGSLTLVDQNGKLVFRKFVVAGTAGQCLMTHDIVEKDEDIPYFWYHAGGGLFNLITAGICCLVFLNSSNKNINFGFQIAAIISALLGFINLVPLKAIGLSNDGSNIMEQFRSPKMRRLLLNTLIINGRQCQGETLDEMPESLFEGGDPTGGIAETGMYLNCAARDCEIRDFETAKHRYKALLDNDKLVEILRNEAECEKIFCDIVTGCEPTDRIDEHYEEMKKYIVASGQTMIARHRLMFAYYYIYRRDKTAADKEYNLAAKMSEKYVNLGEAKAEIAMIEYIKENYR